MPTPLYSDGLIYLTNAHGGSHIFAVRDSAAGTLDTSNNGADEEGLQWMTGNDGCYMPTPLVKGGLFYGFNDNGRLSVRDAASGELIYRQRVGTGTRTYSASPVAAGGNLYFTAENGRVYVVAEGRTYARIAGNSMNDLCLATPAISGDRLLIRTREHLYCLAGHEPPPEEADTPDSDNPACPD